MNFLRMNPDFVVNISTASQADAFSVRYESNYKGFVGRVLRGAKMMTFDGVLDETAAALQFPDYLGRNWSAFSDCLSDLDWLLPTAGIALVVVDAHRLLSQESDGDFRVFLQTCRAAHLEFTQESMLGNSWDHPSMAFHLVFNTLPECVEQLTARITEAGFATGAAD